MWSATIVNYDKKENNLSFDMVVDFTNGQVTKRINFLVSDPNSIDRLISNQIKQYEAIDAFLGTAPVGQWSKPAEPVVTEPSEAQLAEMAYQQKYAELVKAKQDLSLGLIDQTEYDSKLSELQSAKVAIK